MKIMFLLFFTVFFLVNIAAQNKSDLEKIVETEKAFAKFAAESGTKKAFLNFLADDGLIFQPDAVNGKEFWKDRPESPALLSWQPAWADISANGVLGYTTGDWEFRPKGKDDIPVAFGQYFTIWQRQADGNYKAVLDLGTTNEKPANIETEWKSPKKSADALPENKSRVEDTANAFFDTAKLKDLSNAYKLYLADDVHFLRNGKFPIVGKDAVLAEIKKDRSSLNIGKKVVFISAGDLAYISNKYEITKKDKITEKGNFAQIWKLRNGKWQIVMDVFSSIPDEKN